MGERPHALLTEKQRQHLRGELEYDDEYGRQKRYQRSQSIRDRLRGGILDFSLLERLDDADRHAVFDGLGMGDVIEPLIAMVAFVYECSNALGLQPDKILQEGIQRGVDRTGGGVVTLDVTVEENPEGLLERFEAGDPTLTLSDVGRLLGAGMVDREEAKEFNEEAFKDRDWFKDPDAVADDLDVDLEDTDDVDE